MNYEKIVNRILDEVFVEGISRDEVAKIIERACLEAQLEVLRDLRPTDETEAGFIVSSLDIVTNEIEAKLKDMKI